MICRAIIRKYEGSQRASRVADQQDHGAGALQLRLDEERSSVIVPRSVATFSWAGECAARA